MPPPPPSRRHLRFLTLDATGTLMRPRDRIGATYLAHWQRVACSSSSSPSSVLTTTDINAMERQVDMRFPLAFRRHAQLSPNIGRADAISTGNATAAPWWSRVILDSFPEELVNRLPLDAQHQLTSSLYAYYATGAAWRVFDDVVPALREVREMGIPMAVISDFDERLPRLLTDLKLDEFFEVVTTSWAHGATKPAPSVFLDTFDVLAKTDDASKTKRDNSRAHWLHVGDHAKRDYHGATAIGATARLLDRHSHDHNANVSASHANVPADHVVSTLLELLPLLRPPTE